MPIVVDDNVLNYNIYYYHRRIYYRVNIDIRKRLPPQVTYRSSYSQIFYRMSLVLSEMIIISILNIIYINIYLNI